MSVDERANGAAPTGKRPFERRMLGRAATVYLVLLAIYAAASGRKLVHQSFAPHFVYQAHAWLRGRLSLPQPPPNQEDWARVETLTLSDGRILQGRFVGAGQFRHVDGSVHAIPAAPSSNIASREAKWFVSFPPFPAFLFVPVVAVAGLATNDVLFTILLAPLAPALLLLLLDALRRRSVSVLSPTQDLWLVALFSVGSVYFYSSLSGGVWYTAHVVGTALSVLCIWASLGAERPVLAGLCTGLAFATRTPMLFLFPLCLLEAWRVRRSAFFSVAARFAMPVAAIGLLLAAHNWLRFGTPWEFGHAYLTVRWADRIHRWGLFNYHFLSRNLAAAFTLLPRFVAQYPYVQISRHGLSLFFTTPALLYLLWPQRRMAIQRSLWWTVLPIAALSFLYQNDGWIQFGYRFSLDYMALLVCLLAVGTVSPNRFSRLFCALVLWGVIVNTYGALTFDQGDSKRFFEGFFPAE